MTNPTPEPNLPVPAPKPFNPSDWGPYPPYIPESQVDLSHLPESALDGIHGTRPQDDIVLWKPTPENPLPPYWMNDYTEMSPGVWRRLTKEDYEKMPPGQTRPMSGSGDDLKVDTAELRQAAEKHNERGQAWRNVAANPPNDPDALAASWGPIAHPATESLRASNAQRAQSASSIGNEHEDLAGKLRVAAAAYDRTDESSAQAVTSAGDATIQPAGVISNPDPVLQRDLPGAGSTNPGPRIPASVISPTPRSL